jgi:general secretion pathway protein J
MFVFHLARVQSFGFFPLTTALSRRERENRILSSVRMDRLVCPSVFKRREAATIAVKALDDSRRTITSPSPGGEGRDEGGIDHWQSAACRSGFTLLELLLAVLVFSIVLGAIQVVFFSALRLRSRTAESIERSLPLQQTLAIVKRDLGNLVPPGGVLSGALQSTPTISTSGSITGSRRGQNGPEFYTATGVVDDNTPWSEIRRVSYYLSSPTNDTPGQDLYRSVARNLLPVTQDETDDQFLMSGVESIEFQYYDGNAWRDTWDSTQVDSATGLSNNLPRAIRLELQLHYENRAAGVPAPVQLIVPVVALTRTNVTSGIN